jgi:hypothetical protein
VSNGHVTTPDDTATGAGPWPSAVSDGDWWSDDPAPEVEPAAPAGVGKKGAMPRPEAVRPYDTTLRAVTTVRTEAATSPVDDPAPTTTVDEPPGRTGPFDEPPRVRSTPPSKPAPIRPPRPIAPMLRRTPLPPPVDAFPVEPSAVQSPVETRPEPDQLDELDKADLGALGLLPQPVARPSLRPRLSARRPLARPRPAPVVRLSKKPRSPWLAMPGLVVLMTLAAFLGWVSAEPFWLSVGHGEPGTVTVLSSGSVCQGSFQAAAFTVSTVDIDGLAGGGCRVGAAHPARMVSATGARAYVASDRGLVLRWGIGFALVLACGFALAWVLGAYRFTGRRRRLAILTSLAAPYVVVVALLIAAY